MPSQYIPGHEPPNLPDRILAHPFILPQSAMCFMFGLMIFLSGFTDITISRSLDDASMWVILAVSLPLMGGAPAAAYGAINPGYKMSRLTAMAVERIGNTGVGTGILAFGVGIILSGNTFAIGTALLVSGIASGFLLRALALWFSERRVEAHLENQRPTGG